MLTRAADRLLDVAFEQAIQGEEVPVYDQDGVRTGVKWKYNTRMAMFLLKAYHPERFRHADTARRADAPSPPPAIPVAEAVAALAPVPPAEPHLLAPPATIKFWVADAEHQAQKDAARPQLDDSFRAQTVPKQPDRVYNRADRRRARRERQVEREDERYGNPERFRSDGDDEQP